MDKYLVINFNNRIFVPIAKGFTTIGLAVMELLLDFNNDLEGNTRRIEQAVNKFQPDVIFSFGWWKDNIDIARYKQIVKATNCTHVYWTHDDPVYLNELSVPMADISDCIFSTNGDSIYTYKRLGIQAEFLAFACDPDVHKKVPPCSEYTQDIVLLANNYNLKSDIAFPFRTESISNVLVPLLNEKYDVGVYGLWWDDRERVFTLPSQFFKGRVHPGAGDEAKAYSSSKIALGLASVNTSKTMLSMRTFEAMGCGIPYLSQYTMALENTFVNGKHLLLSNSPEETICCVDFLLRHEPIRDMIAREGQSIVYEHHKYSDRAKTVRNVVEETRKKTWVMNGTTHKSRKYKVLLFNFNAKAPINIYKGFEELGYDVYNYVLTPEESGNEQLEKNLHHMIETFKPDVMISIGYWLEQIDLDFFTHLIKEQGILHAYWAIDDPVFYDLISLPIARKVDFVFTTDMNCINKYHMEGIKAYFLIYGCNPSLQRKILPIAEYQHDFVLLAHNYNAWDQPYFNYRINGINNVLRPLVEVGHDVMVWGLWWMHLDYSYKLPEINYGGLLPSGNEASVYSSAKVVLGLQSVGNSESMLSIRTFEAMCCGTFHLSQYSPALEHYFKKGIHLEWSNSPDETKEMADFYLKNEAIRNQVALRGQQEVLAKHTMKHRALDVMSVLDQFM